MKNVLILSTLFASFLPGTGSLAADAGAFPRDQVQGKVRCVLMSVGQTTVFPNNNPNEPPHGDKSGVPCLTITYLIERLGNEPFRGTAQKEIKISAGGKPLKLLNSRSGSYTKSFGYEQFPNFLDFTKPAVADPARAIIIQHVEFGALPNLKPVDVAINAGFDDDVPAFRFVAVRLQ